MKSFKDLDYIRFNSNFSQYSSKIKPQHSFSISLKFQFHLFSNSCDVLPMQNLFLKTLASDELTSISPKVQYNRSSWDDNDFLNCFCGMADGRKALAVFSTWAIVRGSHRP